jgi:outer membrane protein OmpA-like peptidoglycan-associated protein
MLMKKYFLIIGALIFVSPSFAQQGIYTKEKSKEKNCFTEYYDAFVTRGAIPVKDGEHNIIISLRTDTSCTCGEGKVNVKGGKIVPPVMVKKVDGTYEPSKRKLLAKLAKSQATSAHLYFISNGMSQTFSTNDHYWANLFFVDALKRKVVANSTAPSPDDIAGIQPGGLTEKEKELIKTTYQGLQFANGKTKILKSSYGQLNLFADMLKEKKDYNLFIKGYTDNVGSAASNLKLSQGRADAVMDYLINKGVDSQRITAEGFGMENPVADNNTAEGRAQNRRVEFTVIQ